MLEGFLLILLCQLAGESIVTALSMPVPGPVLGMGLLLLGLLVAGGVGTGLRHSAEGLLRYLGLLYIPAGVGLMNHLPLLQREGLGLLLALVVSTAVALLTTALTMKWLSRKTDSSPG